MGVTGVDRLELVVSPAPVSDWRHARPLWDVLPGVGVDLSKKGGGERKSDTRTRTGGSGFPLLPPGKYELRASKQDFEPVSLPEIIIHNHGNFSSRAASSARDALRAGASVIKPAL
jgi:hypothetical protein